MLPVYVDLDDVLSDTTKSFIKILECEFGKKVNFEDIFSFDLKVSFNLTEIEFEHFFQMVHQPDVILEFAPMERAIGVLEEWTELGYEVSIVTGRLTAAYETSIAWLAKHNVPYHSFAMVDKFSRKNIDRDIAISLEDFSELKFSLAIEDSAKMALYSSQKMCIPVALINRLWNRMANLNNKIKRFRSWYDILNDFPTP